jgi:hypothetical protein
MSFRKTILLASVSCSWQVSEASDLVGWTDVSLWIACARVIDVRRGLSARRWPAANRIAARASGMLLDWPAVLLRYVFAHAQTLGMKSLFSPRFSKCHAWPSAASMPRNLLTAL